ncbi:MAG: hypothetical protein EOP40_05220 [Rubrivivax sp.]|nr:MAG: hypothetical protein EOP40_05220 [Rubrivivax sp.]
MIRKLLAALMLLGAIPVGVMAQNAEMPGISRSLIVKLKSSAREGGLLTSLEKDVRRQRLANVAASAGFTASSPWRAMGPRVALLTAPSALKPETAKKLMAKMMASGEVEWVEPNVRQKRAAVSPDDFYYANYSGGAGQWWLKEATTSNTDAQASRQRGVPSVNVSWDAWQAAVAARVTPRPGVIIAVLDTGHTQHPEIDQARILPGYDFVLDGNFDNDSSPGARDSDPSDPGDYVTRAEAALPAFKQLGCVEDSSSWHGLAITGLLAAKSNNQSGVASINWDARILPVRVAGKCGANLVDIIDGMRWAAGLYPINGVYNPNPAKIVNISFGGNGVCGPAYQDAVNDLRAAGVIVVAAAGNEHAGVSRPANCTHVVGVAALNREGFKSSYSNFGSQVTISTVGGDPGTGSDGRWGNELADEGLLTAYSSSPTTPDIGNSAYYYISGTSFATPIVAGVISLMLEVNPALTPDQIIEGLRLSARPHVVSSRARTCSNDNPGRCICTTASCGAGILDAPEALRYAAGSYTPPMRLAQSIDSSELIAAVTAYAQDLPANAASSTSGTDGGSGGGGGGAVDALTLLAGAAMALWLTTSGRAGRKTLARR